MNAPRSATAEASPNIALIKYWGDADHDLRIPANGSISMTLGGLSTVTRVTFDPALQQDRLLIGGEPAPPAALERVARHLDVLRAHAGMGAHAHVESTNSFPGGAGIASSASAFAALTVAALAAAGCAADSVTLSRLARRGSGSACRSILGGFVEWQAGASDADSFATQLIPSEHWALADLVAVVSQAPKDIGSTEGHRLASTSPLQAARVADAPRRLSLCREAILRRDFSALAEVVELDSHMMHAVMMTSSPPLLYWIPLTVELLRAVAALRRGGIGVCATIDAGPNVHCLCEPGAAPAVERALSGMPGVERVLTCPPGAPARVLHPVSG
jgi:diphosphomevalonate decarboxylase